VSASKSRLSKISGSGRKCCCVPVSVVSPITFRGVTSIPRSHLIWCTWPSLLTVVSRYSERAFTTDSPTPCRPPDTL